MQHLKKFNLSNLYFDYYIFFLQLGFMFMACTLIFASIHPEVLEKSMQTCPVGDNTKNQDIVIDVNVKGDQVKLETCGDVMFVQKKFTKGTSSNLVVMVVMLI